MCSDDHRFLATEQAQACDVPLSGTLLEPLARNTAPAIALAAQKLLAAGDAPLMLVLPSDHVFADAEAFRAAVEVARFAAEGGRLVTFGIVPYHPETGYGYIRAGEARGDGSMVVQAFVEKPDRDTAVRYLAEGGYFWNSGMFLFRASVFLSQLRRFGPEMLAACEAALAAARIDLYFCRLDKAAFAACPSDSVDYAVMEKTDLAAVVPLEAGWNDVGAWSAVWQVAARDADGNAARGDVMLEGYRDSYVHAEHRLVSLLGVEDVVVVETHDAVLVAHKERGAAGEDAGRPPEGRRAAGGERAPGGVPALGILRFDRLRTPLSGETDQRETGRTPVAADAPPSR